MQFEPVGRWRDLQANLDVKGLTHLERVCSRQCKQQETHKQGRLIIIKQGPDFFFPSSCFEGEVLGKRLEVREEVRCRTG